MGEDGNIMRRGGGTNEKSMRMKAFSRAGMFYKRFNRWRLEWLRLVLLSEQDFIPIWTDVFGTRIRCPVRALLAASPIDKLRRSAFHIDVQPIKAIRELATRNTNSDVRICLK